MAIITDSNSVGQYIRRKFLEKISDTHEEVTKLSFITDNSLEKRAKSLGYRVYKLQDEISAIDLITEAIISSNEFILEDGNGLFFCYMYIKKLNIQCLNTERVKCMDRMFGYCADLKELDIRHFNTEQVESMKEMFEYCDSLKELDIRNFRTEQVRNMDRMFASCKNLEKLDLSNFNTANVRGMSEMFNYCSNLKELDISSFRTEQVRHMDRMFRLCSNLKALDLSNFNTLKVEDMSNMFDSCDSLEELDISSFDIDTNTNINGMFTNCLKLQKIYVNNRIKEIIIAELNRTILMNAGAGIIYTYQIDNIKDIGNNKIVIEMRLKTV